MIEQLSRLDVPYDEILSGSRRFSGMDWSVNQDRVGRLMLVVQEEFES
jgi:hypothetical protein